jgi:hypothetical protein
MEGAVQGTEGLARQEGRQGLERRQAPFQGMSRFQQIGFILP